MKTLIVYKSVHHGNTKKVAQVMAKVLQAKLVEVDQIKAKELGKYNLIGIGSGVYFGTFHEQTLKFIDQLPADKRVFLFATSGTANGLLQLGAFNFFQKAEEKLRERKCQLLGKFDCRGWDTYVLSSWGGISKNRPNAQDLKRAEEFAGKLNKF